MIKMMEREYFKAINLQANKHLQAASKKKVLNRNKPSSLKISKRFTVIKEIKMDVIKEVNETISETSSEIDQQPQPFIKKVRF